MILTGPRPTEGDFGMTPEVIFAQQLWDAFRDPRKSIFRETPALKFDKNADGTYTPKIKFPPAPAQKDAFHPFKIYQPANYPAYGLIFDSSGNASRCAIDSTVPTNLPTTLNPNTDSWRIFAVRNGLVGTRSFSFIFSPTTESFQSGNSAFIDIAENYYWSYGVFDPSNYGTDGISPNRFFVNPGSWGVPYDEQTSAITLFDGDPNQPLGQVLIYGGTLSGGSGLFSIWIDSLEIKIRALDDVTLSGLNPNSPFLIPAGSIEFVLGVPYVTQVLFGNAINCFPQGMYSPGALPTSIANIKSGALNLRGSWTADSLSGQVFYDGDYVIDDSTANETYYVATGSGGAVTTQVQLYGMYAYKGGVNIESTSPANDLTNWVKIGTIKL